MPIAARSAGFSFALRNAVFTTRRVTVQISSGSCSTQPGGVLRDRGVPAAAHAAGVVKDDGRAAGGALVDGQDVAVHHLPSRAGNIGVKGSRVQGVAGSRVRAFAG